LNESEETALVRRCQAGDKEAFRMLVEQHKNVLFGTAYLITQDRVQAEDAVQCALVQMWKHLPSTRLHGRIKAWLIRIVINEVKQQSRKKRIPTVSLDQVSEIADCPDEAGIAVIRDEEHQLLRNALDRLPPEQRETVMLRYFSELSVPEIAAIMKQREGTIKSRLSRALDHLNDMLRDDEAMDERRRKS